MVGAVTAGCLLGSDYVTGIYFHDPQFYAQHWWPKLASFWLAAAIVQSMLLRREETITASEVPAAQSSIFREQDRFFGIRMKYWPPILVAIGMLSCVLND